MRSRDVRWWFNSTHRGRKMKTLKFRIKDKYAKWLNMLATDTNLVWNYVNELSYRNIRDFGKFLSAFDIGKLLAGATKEGLRLKADSAQAIATRYCIARRMAKKRKLRWRKSYGTNRSLGWIPFKIGNIRVKDGYLWYGKHKFKVWDSYGLENYELRSGSFNEDVQGRWYFNVYVDVKGEPSKGVDEVGIDLGLKEFATLSTGEKIEARQFYRDLEPKLAIAQRAKKKQRVSALHAKIRNRRKDFLHKLSTRLVAENKQIFVGDVNSSGLAKTKMAKSVLDAGWSMFRAMLEYKAIRRQVSFAMVNEKWTSRACSVCKNRTGPQGLGGLGIREWECSDCGACHDRDVNAARNILALGHERLVGGIS